MSEIATIGLDIAKNVFQLHGVDRNGKIVLRKALRRSQVPDFFSWGAPLRHDMHISSLIFTLAWDVRMLLRARDGRWGSGRPAIS